jgi:hypothetical protein
VRRLGRNGWVLWAAFPKPIFRPILKPKPARPAGRRSPGTGRADQLRRRAPDGVRTVRTAAFAYGSRARARTGCGLELIETL